MSAVDRGGRIAERRVIDALGWSPGTGLRVDVARTHLTLPRAIDGGLAVKDHRYLWLPATTRQRLGPRPGYRVLLAAEPESKTLVAYQRRACVPRRDQLLGILGQLVRG